jgi:carbonic anhydrase
MRNLIHGIHQFQNQDFRELHDLFQELVHGQNPETLFITCSDSRIDPNRLTHSLPGDLFILRNAGNIVPPHGVHATGESATIEFAVTGLGVKDIIVCGHSHCGAIKALLNPETIAEMPAMQGWLSHSEATRRIMRENYPNLEGDELLMAAIEENVLVQIEHLQTLPAVAARRARGAIHLHAWVYKFETGDVFAYDPRQQQFARLSRLQRSPDEPAIPHRDPTI